RMDSASKVPLEIRQTQNTRPLIALPLFIMEITCSQPRSSKTRFTGKSPASRLRLPKFDSPVNPGGPAECLLAPRSRYCFGLYHRRKGGTRWRIRRVRDGNLGEDF